jgi:hypothetical protein
LQHGAVGSRIDLTFFRVLGDEEIVGAYVTTAVEFVPTQDGKGFEVDIFYDSREREKQCRSA